MRLAPAGLLGLTLLGIFVRDLVVRGGGGPVIKTVRLPDPEIDPNPRLALAYFAEWMQFGLTALENGQRKRLTFYDNGKSNFPAIRIDGNAYAPGVFNLTEGSWEKDQGASAPGVSKGQNPGRFEEKAVSLSTDANGRPRIGQRSAWLWDRYNVVLTQVVEIIAGQVDPATGKLPLDTCLVHFTLTNKDSRPHKVGMRFLLDTFIGTRDDVPFQVPRPNNPLVDTKDQFEQNNMPDYIQALETGRLSDPGTVARVSLKVGGGLEAPTRVALTHHIQDYPTLKDGEVRVLNFEIPFADIGVSGDHRSVPAGQKKADSAVVLYWEDRELAPGEKREVGFAYGLGHIATGAGGKLGVSPATNPRTGEGFPVTALVTDPVAGQSVEIVLPAELQLVEGAVKQTVPLVAQGSANNINSVTWRIKAAEAGTYQFWVVSSTGEKQQVTVVVTARDSIFK
jgi:hypothetical protein